MFWRKKKPKVFVRDGHWGYVVKAVTVWPTGELTYKSEKEVVRLDPKFEGNVWWWLVRPEGNKPLEIG